VRPEGLDKFKKITSSGIEPATFLLPRVPVTRDNRNYENYEFFIRGGNGVSQLCRISRKCRGMKDLCHVRNY
jgi:hypothetical protein